MTRHAVARRYASALFDVAHHRKATDAVARDLEALRALLVSHDELRRTFDSPAVPAPRKRAILEALLPKLEPLSTEVRRMLGLLAESDRLGFIDEIASAFAVRLLEARKVVAAELTTASPLDADRKTALAAALGKATGGTVHLNERVDPDLIAGVVARVGSLVFDGSVRRQIERFRQKLLAEA